MFADWPLGSTWEQTELALLAGGSLAETPAARIVMRAALSKLDDCRAKCPGVGGDVDAMNLRAMLERHEFHPSTLAQAADRLRSLSESLDIDAREEVIALSEIAGRGVKQQTSALIEKIARMTPYSDGTPESDGIAPDGEDAMRVLNHLITSARAVTAHGEDFSSRVVYHLSQLIDAAGQVEKHWESGDLADSVRNLMGERDDASALLERMEKGGAL